MFSISHKRLKNREGGTLLNSFRGAGITFTLDPVKDSLRREIRGQTHSSHRNENQKQNVSKQILQDMTREVHKMP